MHVQFYTFEFPPCKGKSWNTISISTTILSPRVDKTGCVPFSFLVMKSGIFLVCFFILNARQKPKPKPFWLVL